MINFFICEDNIFMGNIIKKYISDYINKNNIKCDIKLFTNNFEQIIKYSKINSNKVNVYFLDIVLDQNTNGLILAKNIRKYDYLGYIIFITGHAELSYRTFEYNLKALDYIFKCDENTKERISKCLDIIKRENKNFQLKGDIEESILIKSGINHHNIPLRDIIYFETETKKRKIILNTIDNKIEFIDSMKNLQSKLNNSFCRCHRAYIVNINHIKMICNKKNDMHVIVSNDNKCLLSKKYLKTLLNSMQNT